MLVALHGFTETDDLWQEVLDPLGLDLRCPLLPGHGWRPCPSTMSVATCAADVARELPAQPVDLLGYSMGGRLALRLALDQPTRVRRLILVSTRAGILSPSDRQARVSRDEALAEILEEDGIGPFVAWWENQPILRPHRKLPRNETEDLRSRRLNQDPLGLASALRQLGQGVMEPMWERLATLTIPVLLVVGSADTELVADSERMCTLLPAGRVAVIPACGHAVHRESPTELRRAIASFLVG